MRRRSAK
nr:hypothetical protein (T1 5' region) - mouse [Mus musculus]